MKVTISLKHLDHTPALDDRIREKSEQFSKYFQGTAAVNWVCWLHEAEHWAEVKIHAGHQDFFAKASTENSYKTLDKVVDRVERQLEKHKDQMKRLHRRKALSELAEETEGEVHAEY